jgi:hypothetical protein
MPTLRLSEALATELDYMLSLRRQRVLDARQYVDAKRMIFNQQAILDDEARQRRVAEELALKEALTKARRKEARERRKIKKDVLFDEVVDENVFPFLVRLWKAVKGVPGARIFVNGEEYDVPEAKSSKEFVRAWFGGGSDDDNLFLEEGMRIVALKPSRIPAAKIEQMFRDGVEHCVFQPILAKMNAIVAEASAGRTRERWNARIRKVRELETTYEAGVPEEKMEEVAEAAGLGLSIHDIVGNKIRSWNESKQRDSIHFVNTRPNHVDIGKIVLSRSEESVELSAEELREKAAKLRERKEFFMWMGPESDPMSISTIGAVYCLKNPDREYFKQMNELVGVDKYRLNATKYPAVNDFIYSARIINSTPITISGGEPTGHIDMPKAYTQFKNCAWYAGFLGVVQQWATGSFDAAWLRQHLGIYRARVVGGVDLLAAKLGLRVGESVTLPSVELLYFMDYGVQFEVYDGVWGSRMDFEFPDYMMKKGRYSHWSGRMGMERHEKRFSFTCSREWASHLAAELGDNCHYYERTGTCSISVPNKATYTLHHILAFITSYTRMNVMEMMRKFKIENICKVVLDGIYFVGDKPDGCDWPNKPMIPHKHVAEFWYDGFQEAVYWPEYQFAENTLLTGQGGCGKTHTTMTHPGYNNILYVTPEHILGQGVRATFGVNYTTIHKLIGIAGDYGKCRPYKDEYSYPPVIFIDELTQIHAGWIDKAFELYPESLIILAGDVEGAQWFQCRTGRPGDFSKVWSGKISAVHIPGDRRSRDEELVNFKLRVRELMRQVFVDGDSCEDMSIAASVKKSFPCLEFEEAVGMFREGDTWIAGTHKTNEKLLERGVVSGWYKEGGHISAVEKEGYKKRGSFTIHSYQGQTIESGKIFISVGDLFEYAMFYTAVSRAVHYSQLVFVK